jgi:hypothetical protein
MPTDERGLPLMPIPSWQRPPTTRNRKGQWMPGVSGNPRGAPTKARLAAKRAAIGEYEHLSRLASYEGMTPDQFVRVARTVYGPWWQGQFAADLMMSRQGVIRWAKGKHKISLEKETLLLLLCLRRVRAAHALVRSMYRRAVAAVSARQQLAAMPRYKALTRPGERRTVF